MTVQERVRDVLVNALNVEPEDVTPQATLQGDLGAESIDMLDITFRLEREFDIKIPRNELFPEGIFDDDPKCVTDGKVTQEGRRRIREAIPWADDTLLDTNPDVKNVYNLFTVGAVTKYVEGKLNGGFPTGKLVQPPSGG